MRNTPTPPIVGQGLSINFGRRIIEEIRANRIIPGKNVTVVYTRNGTIVNGTPGGSTIAADAATDIKPFTVRWMSHDKDGSNPRSGEWQVYLPYGSMIVHYGGASEDNRRYAALATNNDGKDADNKITYQWYKITDPVDETATIQTINGKVHKAWTVYVLTKPWARFLVSVYSKANDPVAWSDAIATIGTAEYTSGGKTYVLHSVIQHFSGEMTKIWDNRSAFAVDYELNDETSKNSTYTANVINQTKMLGRLQESNADPVNVKNASEVWIKIEHPGEQFDLSVLPSAPSDTDSNDDQTVYKIYDMQSGVVIKDYRSEIPVLPFYTNPAE